MMPLDKACERKSAGVSAYDPKRTHAACLSEPRAYERETVQENAEAGKLQSA